MQKFKIASCTGGFRNLGFEETLLALKKIGIKCIEGTTDGRAHLYPYIFSKKDSKHLKQFLDQHGLKLVAVSGGWSDFAVIDRYIEKQYKSLKQQLKFCQRFDIKILRIFASHIPGQFIDKNLIKRVIRNLKRIMPEAKKHNVCLVIENHYGITAKADDVLRIIEGVANPYLKVNFDAANFVLMKENPVRACQRLLPYIDHLHLKDIRRTNQEPDYKNAYLTGRDIHRGYKFCEFGKGTVNYLKIFENLLRSKYKGFYSIEYENTSDPIQGTKIFYKNLKENLANLGLEN